MPKNSIIETQFEFFNQMLKIRNCVSHMLQQGLCETGLSIREWEFLVYIYQNKKTNISNLASTFNVTKPLVSKVSWKLLQNKLIQSRVNQKDRRHIELSLTVIGQEKVRMVKEEIASNFKSYQQENEFSLFAEQVSVLEHRLSAVKD